MTFSAVWKEKIDILVAAVARLFYDMEIPEISILSDGKKGFFSYSILVPSMYAYMVLVSL